MLQPANESLTSPCVPASFNEDYPAYAYLFALLAALAMQALEYGVALCLITRIRAPDGDECAHVNENGAGGVSEVGGGELPAQSLPLPSMPSLQKEYGGGSGGGGYGTFIADAAATNVTAPLLVEVHGHTHGHVHASLPASNDDGGGAVFVSALLMEFGFTVHSVFIGLAVGVAGDDNLKPLLIALSFHQFFEGVALGARITDATLPGALDYIFALIFALSAPLGIGIGVALNASGSVFASGASFLLVQGTFDAICAGILLYIGFAMLLSEFPRDLTRLCDGPTAPCKGAAMRRAVLFTALWGGGGLMAFIGRYL